jgi:hypothetical protein
MAFNIGDVVNYAPLGSTPCVIDAIYTHNPYVAPGDTTDQYYDPRDGVEGADTTYHEIKWLTSDDSEEQFRIVRWSDLSPA